MEKNQYMGAGKARARQCAPVNTWARGAVRAEPQKGEHGTSLPGPHMLENIIHKRPEKIMIWFLSWVKAELKN